MFKKNSDDKTISLIKSQLFKIYSKPTKWKKVFGFDDTRISLLDEINLHDNPILLKHIIHFILDNNSILANKTELKIVSFISSLSVSDLIRVDSTFRKYEYLDYKPKDFLLEQDLFPTISLNDLNKIRQFSSWQLLMGVASMSPSGFIRERAIELLADSDSGEEIKFLFLRFKDNVPQVREKAYKAIIQRLEPRYAGFLIKNMEFLPRTQFWLRAEEINLLSKIEQFFFSNITIESIINDLKSGNLCKRKVCAKFIASSKIPLLDSFNLIKKDPDPTVRRIFWNTIKLQNINDEIKDIVSLLFRDSDPKLRFEAINFAIERKLPFSDQFINEGLLDKSSTIREISRYFLRKTGKSNDDFRRIYLDIMSSNKLSAKIIDCLGEVGKLEDVELISPFLEHEQIAIQRASFLAIGKLCPTSLDNKVMNILINGSASMIKAVCFFVCHHIERFVFNDFKEVYFQSNKIQTQKAILKISDYASKWEKIIFWLLVLNENDSIKSLIKCRISSWNIMFNSSYVIPSESQIGEMKFLLKEKSKFIEPEDTNFLVFVLDSLS